MKEMRKRPFRPSLMFIHAFLMISSLLCLFPFYWMVVGATNSSKEITKGVLWFGREFMNNIQAMMSSGGNYWRAS